ncbi:MAG: hypothetical protein QM778_08215 [Myxococcales bacterium]
MSKPNDSVVVSQAAASLPPHRSPLQQALWARLRLVSVTLAGLALAQVVGGDVLSSGYAPLSDVLSTHGLAVTSAEAKSLKKQRRGADAQLIVFRAAEGQGAGAAQSGLGDVWAAEAILAEDGRVAELDRVHNLTRTSSADETTPITNGRWVLFARTIEGKTVGLELLDLDGEPATQQGPLARIQRGISNLQQTGQWGGVGKRSYTFKTPAATLKMRAERARFVVEADGDPLVIDPVYEHPLEGDWLVDVRAPAPGVTELVPWLVDTVRGIPWIGAEKIAWLENKVFAVRDRVKQAYHSVNTVDHAAEAAADLGITKQMPAAEEQKVERLSVPDPESGWPPPALTPLIATPEVPGEGKWRAIVDDPYVRDLPDGNPVFFQSFLRADPQRDWARVYLTLWDPRVVQLNIVAGTEEPLSATGETGTGAIPHTPDVLTRLVGAFNGGFQAVHGEFGMMADGRVYLPPKPWAATVAVFDDGHVGMGSWPGPQDRRAGYDEARAVAEIPAGMIAFRQNLTSLVEDAHFNPWNRWWWGAAPKQQSEQTLTQRSALCITQEGFMVYAWGDSASPEALGAALVAARCARAMHLDMNSGHSGMEFYNVLAPQESRAPAEKKAAFRTESAMPELPGYLLRARKAVTSMGMALPRYIHPDPRDYFYLTLKPSLTGTKLEGPLGSKLSSRDLPHAGWPPAFARHADDAVRLLRIDPARAVPTSAAPEGGQLVLAELRGAPEEARLDDYVLHAEKTATGRKFVVGVPPQGADILMRAPQLRPDSVAFAALGVDASGLLLYAETDEAKPGALHEVLAAHGVKSALWLPKDTRLGLHFREGVLGVDGRSRSREAPAQLFLLASSVPATEVLFPNNPPIPYARWAHLQDQRVRYFRTSEPTTKAPVGALDAPK